MTVKASKGLKMLLYPVSGLIRQELRQY